MADDHTNTSPHVIQHTQMPQTLLQEQGVQTLEGSIDVYCDGLEVDDVIEVKILILRLLIHGGEGCIWHVWLHLIFVSFFRDRAAATLGFVEIFFLEETLELTAED